MSPSPGGNQAAAYHMESRQEPEEDEGIYRGKSVARLFHSPDGMLVLVGRSAADNDILTFELAAPGDFWLHVAGESGSHVVVRNPEGLETLPRDTLRFAAALAAGHSKARRASKVAVHVAQRRDVRKGRGQPPGTVLLSSYRSVKVAPRRE